MLWLLLCLFSALTQTARDLFSKKCLRNLDEYSVAFSMRALLVAFLLPSLFFIKIPSLSATFWITILSSGPAFTVASILHLKAIKISPLSLTIPMLAFTPHFLLITSLILGESPSFSGLIGILLTVVGTHILSIKDVSKGYIAPFEALIKEKGAMIMLLVAFLLSAVGNLSKIGIQESDLLFFPIIRNAFTSSLMLPVMLKKLGGLWTGYILT